MPNPYRVYTNTKNHVMDIAGWRDEREVQDMLKEANNRVPSEAPHYAIRDGDIINSRE